MLGSLFTFPKLLYQEKHFKTNNMAQQTAVEWLIEQLAELDKQLDGRRKSNDSTVIKLNPTRVYEQAKQMEKEQIVDAHYQGYRNDIGTTEVSEQYYNETFTSIPQGENPSATEIEQ